MEILSIDIQWTGIGVACLLAKGLAKGLAIALKTSTLLKPKIRSCPACDCGQDSFLGFWFTCAYLLPTQKAAT